MKRLLNLFRRRSTSPSLAGRETAHAPIPPPNLNEPRWWIGRYPQVPPPEQKLSPKMFVARYFCRDIRAEDTTAVAADLLTAGHDTPALRRLAGETQIKSPADAAELMEMVTREAGLPVPFPMRLARIIVTRQIARLVIAGERDPRDAASEVAGTWGWRPENVDAHVKAILNCVSNAVWDDDAKRYRPVVDTDLLDSFASVGQLTDEQIFS